ncbi:STAS domain-containing protein [Streptomyces sp. NPDC002221]|uniref:STAS domain-containing protein n=1 Tax=Streptomyces sp. NPDC002221 TaxID=3364639 RepID=UPI0036B13685
MTAYACAGGPNMPSGGLEVDVVPGPDPVTVEVRVRGEIDARSAHVLHQTLLTALTSYRGTLLLDLAQVTACDRSGLDVLLAAHLAAQRAGRRLWITAGSHRVHELLRSTGTRLLLTPSRTPDSR